ncbi:MAG: hypothetical protein KatS3mg054_0142 [Chloroflexus sp.]|nr:MAG: hypothetical protein KatS3mg054_0142 [Chloroflexus sp.]
MKPAMEDWRKVLPKTSTIAVLLKTLHESEWLCSACNRPSLVYAIGIKKNSDGSMDDTVVQSLSSLCKCPQCSDTSPFYLGAISDNADISAGLVTLFLAKSSELLLLGTNNIMPRIAALFTKFSLFHIENSIAMRRYQLSPSRLLLNLRQIRLCRACQSPIATNMAEEQCLNCISGSSFEVENKMTLYNIDVFDPAYCSQLAGMVGKYMPRGVSMFVKYFDEVALC